MTRIELKMSWKRWLVAACVAAAALPVLAQKKDALVIVFKF